MVWTVATWIVIAGCGIGLLYILFTLLLRWPGRTVDDVVDFLRPVDLDQLSMLLDPRADFELSWHLDAGTLCEIRRKRMQKYLELLGRMSHNSRILFEFGNRGVHKIASIADRGTRRTSNSGDCSPPECGGERAYVLRMCHHHSTGTAGGSPDASSVFG